MADIANLGFRADTGDLDAARSKLQAIVPAADKAERSANKLGKSLDSAGQSAQQAANKMSSTDSAADRLASGLMNADNAAEQAATSTVRLAEGYDILTGKINGNFLAINNNLSRIGALSRGVTDVGKSLRFTGVEGLNASRQLADIGVTALSGMSPFLIAIQQGPQLFDILQNKAVMTGTTIGTVFRAAGAQIWAALVPLLPLIAGIALVVGTVTAAFALGTREINKGNKSIIDGLDLTDKQLKRVKKSGVDTSVTMGDTFKAFFEILGERIAWLLGGPLKWLSDTWTAIMDGIVKYGTMAIKLYIGAWVGGYNAIKAVWSLLPAALGDLAYSAANKVISGVQWLIDKSIGGLNKLIAFADSAAAKVGLDGIGQIGPVSLGSVENPFAGAASKAGDAIVTGFKEGMKGSDAAIDRFFGDVGKRARSNREKLIREAAGDAEKAAKGKKPPKSDAEKFADIVSGAEASMRSTQAQIDGLGMTAEAAARLKHETDLLNQAKQQDIKLTDAQTGKIKSLAASMAALDIKLRDMTGFKEINKDADKTIRALDQEYAAIGKIGYAAAYLRAETQLLNQAREKGIDLSKAEYAADLAKLKAKADTIAKGETRNANASAYDADIKAANERRDSLEAERAAIGLNTEATARAMEASRIANNEKYRGIVYSAQEKQDLIDLAAGNAVLAESIDKTKDSLSFAKDIFKGFFTDWSNSIKNGESVFKSFTNSILNSLGRIQDKLMDKLLNSAIDNLFKSFDSSGGGSFLRGLFNAKGNAFGTTGVTQFANGGSFGVVDKPTAFAFGKGGANLGIMGEAGPEAVMPLQRGPDGSLGVQMYGGGGGGSTFAPTLVVNNDNRVTGAVSSADIVEMQRRAAADTESKVKRQIPQWLQQYQRDGAIV